ncbi:MAG: YihY/virulence factor BrkB family protein [Betaproteobacteria bacterium]
MRWRIYLSLLRQAGRGWIADRAPSMGAALAFYSAFSIAPLLIIVSGIVAAVFGEKAAHGAVVGQLAGIVGEHAAEAIQALLMGAESRSSGWVASIVGIVTLLVGATTVLVELQSALDQIWRAEPRRGGVLRLLHSRAISLALILGIGFVFLASLVFTGAMAVFGKNWGSIFPGMTTALFVLNFLVSLAVVTALIAMLYKWLPNAPIKWRDVWIGALTTAILFILGQTAISFYVASTAMASMHGAAGAMLVLLTWLYYSAQIFLFGAEFTRAYANRNESTEADCLGAGASRAIANAPAERAQAG